MRAVIQAVSSASVRVNGGEPRPIGPGLVNLLGVKDTDTLDIVPRLAEKCAGLRIFPDEEGKLNRSARDSGLLGAGSVAVYPLWRHQKGDAPQLYPGCKAAAVGAGIRAFPVRDGAPGPKEIQHGEFGADMQLSLVNEGPCTIIMDTDEWKQKD